MEHNERMHTTHASVPSVPTAGYAGDRSLQGSWLRLSLLSRRVLTILTEPLPSITGIPLPAPPCIHASLWA
jgi:hypothetical protein